MPEGPEALKLQLQLRPAWTGRYIVKFSVPADSTVDARKFAIEGWPEFKHAVTDNKIMNVQRLGKALWVDLATESAWRIHLNSTGWFLPGNDVAKAATITDPIYPNFLHTISEKSRRASLHLDDGQVWDYHDPRTWGKWYLRSGDNPRADPDLTNYGPDWFDEPGKAREALLTHLGNQTLKDVLTDQHVTAGLGNYLACELAHAAKLHPHRVWNSLDAGEKITLGKVIEPFLRLCVMNADHSHWKVFKQGGKKCTCGQVISYVKDGQSGTRGSYFCPGCQPPS